jgi:hypothetical protein
VATPIPAHPHKKLEYALRSLQYGLRAAGSSLAATMDLIYYVLVEMERALIRRQARKDLSERPQDCVELIRADMLERVRIPEIPQQHYRPVPAQDDDAHSERNLPHGDRSPINQHVGIPRSVSAHAISCALVNTASACTDLATGRRRLRWRGTEFARARRAS